MRYIAFVFAVGFFAAANVVAQPMVSPDTVTLRAADTRITVDKQLTVFVDSSAAMDLQQVRLRGTFSKPDSTFYAFAMKKYPTEAFWFSFSLHNAAAHPDTLYFSSEMSDWVTIYQIREDGTLTTRRAGLLINKSIQRDYFDQIVTPVILPANQSVTYYVQVRNEIEKNFDFTDIDLFSKKELQASLETFYRDNAATGILQILFLGFVLWQVIYMSFQWFMNKRQKEYMYYVLYTLFIGAYYYLKYAFFTRLFWPTEYYHWIGYFAQSALLILPYFLYMRFVRYFIDTGTRFPAVDTWLKRIEWFILLYTAVDLVLLRFRMGLPFELTTAVIGIMFVVILFMGIYLFRRRDTLINFLVAGALVAAVGSTISMTLSIVQNWHPIPFSAIVPSQIGLVLEMCFFTAGLGYKARMNEQEKIKSQKQLIVQLEANQKLHDRMYQIRNKIAQDLHDDVGATLSTILLYTNAAKHKAASLPTQESNHFLSKIGESATQMIDEMSDIVWAINSQNDTSESIFTRMHAFAAPLLSANDIEFSFQVDNTVRQELFVMDKRKNLYLIFKEAINNAVKYSSCTRIDVSLTRDGDLIAMTIRDDGKGFDMATVKRGNGISNFEHRAQDMNGSLRLETNPGAGTVLKITFRP